MNIKKAGPLAVLVDCDNTPSDAAPHIMSFLDAFGTSCLRLCFGDVSSPSLAGWNAQLATLGIDAVHQPAHSVGKNASDIALVIEAMDLLHSGAFDGFAIVSSDGDFTRLAHRIRRGGKKVYGV